MLSYGVVGFFRRRYAGTPFQTGVRTQDRIFRTGAKKLSPFAGPLALCAFFFAFFNLIVHEARPFAYQRA